MRPCYLVVVSHTPDTFLHSEIYAIVIEAMNSGGIFRFKKLTKTEVSKVQDISEVQGLQLHDSQLNRPTLPETPAKTQLTGAVSQPLDTVASGEGGGNVPPWADMVVDHSRSEIGKETIGDILRPAIVIQEIRPVIPVLDESDIPKIVTLIVIPVPGGIGDVRVCRELNQSEPA